MYAMIDAHARLESVAERGGGGGGGGGPLTFFPILKNFWVNFLDTE